MARKGRDEAMRYTDALAGVLLRDETWRRRAWLDNTFLYRDGSLVRLKCMGNNHQLQVSTEDITANDWIRLSAPQISDTIHTDNILRVLCSELACDDYVSGKLAIASYLPNDPDAVRVGGQPGKRVYISLEAAKLLRAMLQLGQKDADNAAS
jgi:hypothetical protein